MHIAGNELDPGIVTYAYGTMFAFTVLRVNIQKHRKGCFYGCIHVFSPLVDTPRLHGKVENNDQSFASSSTRNTASHLTLAKGNYVVKQNDIFCPPKRVSLPFPGLAESSSTILHTHFLYLHVFARFYA